MIQIERNNTELGYEYLYFVRHNGSKYYFDPCLDIEKEFKLKVKQSTEVTQHPKVTEETLSFHLRVIDDCKMILIKIREA